MASHAIKRQRDSDTDTQRPAKRNTLDDEPHSSDVSDAESEGFEISKGRKQGGIKGRSNIDDAVLKHRGQTCASALLRKMESGFFGQNIAAVEPPEYGPVSGLENITCDPTVLQEQFLAALRYRDSTSHIKLVGTQRWCDETGEKQGGFPAAIIDGETYSPGDGVIIRSSQAPRHIRLARISYLYKYADGRGEQAHVRLFAHGSEIDVLDEFAGPRALFLVTECQDVPLLSIAGKIQIDFVSQGDAQGDILESRIKKQNNFFCQFRWDAKCSKISDALIAQNESQNLGRFKPHCDCCDEIKKEKDFDTAQLFQGKFCYQRVTYHDNDFVYGLPAVGSLSSIFQIIEIKDRKIPKSKSKSKHRSKTEDVPEPHIYLLVRVLDRPDDHEHYDLKERPIKDNREVLFSDEEVTILPSALEGKCQVRHIADIDDLDHYKDDAEKNNFWVGRKITFNRTRTKDLVLDNSKSIEQFLHTRFGGMIHSVKTIKPNSIKYPTTTDLEREAFEHDKENYLSQCHIPGGLEVFSGVGGMTLGLHNSGSVETKYMVEFSPSAARTAEQNLGGLIAYAEVISSWLQRVYELEAGVDSSHQTDVEGNPVKPVPGRGEIFIIIAGFPCPGYSGANYNPLADDIKNTLILVLLSAIDFYRPAYVLLENVTGLLNHELGAQQSSRNKTEGGIPQGSLKFIVRALTLMGYQVQFAILQAGEHGVPQSRQRVFFWAALQGYDLPKFPQATSTFQGRCPESWHQTRRSAPHRGYTVADATSDLPYFDWVNPHNVLPQSAEEKQNRLERAKLIEQIPVLPGQNYVGHDKQDYATQPQNEFQRKLRSRVTELTNHVTPSWFDRPFYDKKGAISRAKTEQICNVSLDYDSDYTSLPKELVPWHLSHEDSAAAKQNFERAKGRYGRLNADEPFPICLTQVNPGTKGLRIINPTQHRIETVREYARAQGFNDSFKWDLENLDTKLAYRMIGNAVPPPLAEALGREFLKCLVAQFARGSTMPLFERKTGKAGASNVVHQEKTSSKGTMKARGTVENPIGFDDDDDDD